MNLKLSMATAFRSALTLISPELNTRVCYRVKFKRKIDLNNPKTFNEKLSWMKLYYYPQNPIFQQCSDKYAVREYIKEQGCEELLIPLIAAYDHVDEIDWDALPSSFVMKWNFGSGYNIICPDKSKLDKEAVLRQMRKWEKKRQYLYYAELHGVGIPHKIVVEQYLRPSSGVMPDDYKVYCFNGKAHSVMLCQGRDSGEPTFYFFDRDWNLLRINHAGMAAPADFTIPKPAGLSALFDYAEKLSKPFPYVRADFYLIDGKTYFGELTFTPCGGMDSGMPRSLDDMFGELLRLPEPAAKNFK